MTEIQAEGRRLCACANVYQYCIPMMIASAPSESELHDFPLQPTSTTSSTVMASSSALCFRWVTHKKKYSKMAPPHGFPPLPPRPQVFLPVSFKAWSPTLKTCKCFVVSQLERAKWSLHSFLSKLTAGRLSPLQLRSSAALLVLHRLKSYAHSSCHRHFECKHPAAFSTLQDFRAFCSKSSALMQYVADGWLTAWVSTSSVTVFSSAQRNL